MKPKELWQATFSPKEALESLEITVSERTPWDQPLSFPFWWKMEKNLILVTGKTMSQISFLSQEVYLKNSVQTLRKASVLVNIFLLTSHPQSVKLQVSLVKCFLLVIGHCPPPEINDGGWILLVDTLSSHFVFRIYLKLSWQTCHLPSDLHFCSWYLFVMTVNLVPRSLENWTAALLPCRQIATAVL